MTEKGCKTPYGLQSHPSAQALVWKNSFVIIFTGKPEINKAVIVTPASLVKVSLVQILKLEMDISLEFKKMLYSFDIIL